LAVVLSLGNRCAQNRIPLVLSLHFKSVPADGPLENFAVRQKPAGSDVVLITDLPEKALE